MPISIQQLPLPDEVVEIDPDLMDPSPYQMRIEAYEDEDDLKQLAIGIQRLGMDPIPKVRPSPNRPGRFEIMTGHRRRDAVVKYLKWKKIKCSVYKNLNEETVLFMVGEDNMARRNIYPYEKGRFFNIWHDQRATDDSTAAELFGANAKTVYRWRTFTNCIDELGDPLGKDGKNKLIKNATRQKIELLLQIKDKNDLVNACWKVANGGEEGTVEKLQEFVVASLNASSRSASSSGSSKGKGSNGKEAGKENYTQELLSGFKRVEKAKTYEEVVEGVKGLKQTTLKTLDDYMQIKAQLDQIHNAKNKGSITPKKIGRIDVFHKVDDDGSVLCIHEQNGKMLPAIKFRLN